MNCMKKKVTPFVWRRSTAYKICLLHEILTLQTIPTYQPVTHELIEISKNLSTKSSAHDLHYTLQDPSRRVLRHHRLSQSPLGELFLQRSLQRQHR